MSKYTACICDAQIESDGYKVTCKQCSKSMSVHYYDLKKVRESNKDLIRGLNIAIDFIDDRAADQIREILKNVNGVN